MSKIGKTPYEIRLELLQLAAQILTAQHQAKCAEMGNIKMGVSTAATSEEIIAEAEKLNAFVSKAPAP